MGIDDLFSALEKFEEAMEDQKTAAKDANTAFEKLAEAMKDMKAKHVANAKKRPNTPYNKKKGRYRNG